jgi:N-acetylneuraminate synthase
MAIQFIAEIGSNHNRDLNRCITQIDVAKEIGADAVKFQLFHANQLFSESRPDMIKFAKERELPHDFIPEISKHCKEIGIQFGCTPFDLESVTILEPYVDFLKIGSYEILWKELSNACVKTYLPLMISTGMTTMEEAFEAVTETTTVLFHCVSSYPALPRECNLSVLRQMKLGFWGKVGWSDHTVEPGVIYEAIRQGATVIECHLDIDGKGWEFESGHCWLPDKLKGVIQTVQVMETARGSGSKRPSANEKSQLVWRTNPITGLRGEC